LCARGCTKSAVAGRAQCLAQAVDASPSASTSIAIDFAPELLEQVEHRRRSVGMLDDDAVAQPEHVLGDAIERVHRARRRPSSPPVGTATAR
jgi:hypothetical protein